MPLDAAYFFFLVGYYILLSMVVQQLVIIFGVLTREDEHTSFYSATLKKFISSESTEWYAGAGSY